MLEFVRQSIMSPLQERVVGIGVCPKCHKKNLRFVYDGVGMRCYQCEKCNTVWVTSATPPHKPSTTRERHDL